ncbi:MAG: hypothetical protein C4538_02115 [Nitrospiraceae bacterium]|nr:MAG: hypothetical protein C4538_02115 [Nitrospiraceae bacterium]
MINFNLLFTLNVIQNYGYFPLPLRERGGRGGIKVFFSPSPSSPPVKGGEIPIMPAVSFLTT